MALEFMAIVALFGLAMLAPTPQSHESDNFNANGDCPGKQEYTGQITDVHQPQMAGTPSGSCLHDSDYRRNKPPFKGKVEMRKEEAALNEITTIQSLEGDRFHEDNVCNQCGHFGHWLGDCLFPDDNGYIKGCPIHNAKGHNWDDCPDARNMSLERKILYLILRRRNKPAIQSTQPWIALVKVALQQGSEAYCWGPSVWTREFVLKMTRGPKADHPWLDFNYGRQLISTLPKDPETMDDPGVLVERRLLWNQVHRPFPKET
ncbi:uncharacterized protein LY79DRAFT_666316 [Colletotrichum navitas]|uniref:CCHC-type domain-containing protein n=1 Tax=Colletotrichum navitas TaxID=681940 RepID=A0AAD8QAE3_9PEZI|nr:uncharacterized protein LY79DRAFT_666316 [Colletotrichum navitas]KAK1597987.1 hypothetical protein LY79DRAFT_666316 [Colletotrichum navitas]